MEHCFLALTFNLKCRFYIYMENIFKPKNPNQNCVFFLFAYVFINFVIGCNFNIINDLYLIIFPSKRIGGYQLNIKQCIY